MRQRTLGKTGLSVSLVGFGSAPVGILATEQHEAARLMNMALDEGVNLIDTAAAYAGAEASIGKAISPRRDEYILVSKCGSPGTGSDDPSWHPERIAESIDRSLELMQTDHVDVMLLHSCSKGVLQCTDALEALVKARKAGKIRHVGYSGDGEAALYACTLPDIAVIETSINICDQKNIETVLPKAEEQNVGIIAKRPIANAAWKDLSEQPGFYQEYAETYTKRLAAMDVDPTELGFGGPADWAEIALRFTITHPWVHSAIVGSTRVENLKNNLAAAANGPLPDVPYGRLRDAFRRAERGSGQEWVAQT